MPPDTRDALIRAAAKLLDEGGVDAVTLRDVGRLAGVSHNAPYKHFSNKEALLAAIAADDLNTQNAALTALIAERLEPREALRTAMHTYVARALAHPARFKLTFGSWSVESAELAAAADEAQASLIGLVAAAQNAGSLPPGDPERLASLVRALAHGAADLASAGHLEGDGKGHAGPDDLVDDLLEYLRVAAALQRNGGDDA